MIAENRNVQVFKHASELPTEWDRAAPHLFLKKDALTVIERANPCGQRYHLVGSPASLAVTYQHKLDLLSFRPSSLRIPVTMTGIPCSVAKPGLHLADSSCLLLEHLGDLPGINMILNSDSSNLPGFAAGTTLPSCRLELESASFTTYLDSMRSHYRYRVSSATRKWEGVTATALEDNESFDDSLLALYRNVQKRSDYPLEELNTEFFRTFPSRITRFDYKGTPLAFVQTVRDGDELIFMFGGLDYSHLQTHDSYINILLHIIHEAFESDCRAVDLGQTAEDTKLRLGCRIVPKHFHVSHSNRFLHRLLTPLAGPLSYRKLEGKYNVFKT